MDHRHVQAAVIVKIPESAGAAGVCFGGAALPPTSSKGLFPKFGTTARGFIAYCTSVRSLPGKRYLRPCLNRASRGYRAPPFLRPSLYRVSTLTRDGQVRSSKFPLPSWSERTLASSATCVNGRPTARTSLSGLARVSRDSLSRRPCGGECHRRSRRNSRERARYKDHPQRVPLPAQGCLTAESCSKSL
jgi:hypothetical protein